LSHQDAESRFPLLLSFLMMQSMRQRCPMLDSGESPQFVGVHALVSEALPQRCRRSPRNLKELTHRP
jgi:hypothetical protein